MRGLGLVSYGVSTSLLAVGFMVSTSGRAQSVPSPSSTVLRLDNGLDALLEPDVKITRVATGFQFVEGPMWREGRLWFSDLVGNRMYAVTPDGKVTLLIDHAGGLDHPAPGSFTGSNAMATDNDGSVLMIQHGLRRIVRLNRDLTVRPFLERFEGKRFNSPNDLVFAKDGSLWFTDPPFGLAGLEKDPARELHFSGVYRYADGRLTAVMRDLTEPNGIGFSPDGKVIYISNSGPHKFVMRYSVGVNGTLTNGTMLISYPDDPKTNVPDGLKVDSVGNIWSTGPGGIRILTPTGKVLGQIKLPETAANLAWAEDGKTLYITASHSIYRLQTRIAGEMPVYRK